MLERGERQRGGVLERGKRQMGGVLWRGETKGRNAMEGRDRFENHHHNFHGSCS